MHGLFAELVSAVADLWWRRALFRGSPANPRAQSELERFRIWYLSRRVTSSLSKGSQRGQRQRSRPREWRQGPTVVQAGLPTTCNV
mmetsp:Transcript_58385/g.126303  ORF Transcript_58385/g.126303 Transcript_58385/m.126303 type:complete len:86 (+) Transcript_58385:1752-2009(+)